MLYCDVKGLAHLPGDKIATGTVLLDNQTDVVTNIQQRQGL